jgi:hypothetical protein
VCFIKGYPFPERKKGKKGEKRKKKEKKGKNGKKTDPPRKKGFSRVGKGSRGVEWSGGIVPEIVREINASRGAG